MDAIPVETGTTRCSACGAEAVVIIQPEDHEHSHIRVICDECGLEVWGEAIETTSR